MRDHYHGQAAQRYDAVWHTFTTQMLAPVVTEAREHLGAQTKVLDVGCGTGVLLDQLLAQRADLRCWGTDASTDMLTQARTRLGERAQLVVWDLEQPAPVAMQDARPFDLITCTNVAHYLHDPTQAVLRITQLLRPGGYLILTDFTAHGWWWPCFEGILHLADKQHWQTLTPKKLAQIVHDAGLQVRSLRTMSADFPWHGTMVAGTVLF